MKSKFHVSPRAQAGGDGSPERPFASLQAALDSGAVRGGDALLLAGGQYGALRLVGAVFSPDLTICSAAGERAVFDTAVVKDSSGILLKELEMRPAAKVLTAIVHILAGSSNVTLEDLMIVGWTGGEDYYGWSQDDWINRRNKGIQIDGDHCTVTRCTLTAIGTGIGVQGHFASLADNEVNGFSKDGMRVLGDHATVRGNTIVDCFDVDSNHDDGIQMWAERGTPESKITGGLFEDNTIIEWTGPVDHPLHGVLQGFGAFDGPYFDLVIRNNFIAVSTLHGITILGGVACTVENNTVVTADGLPTAEHKPRIVLADGKNGKNPMADNTVRRNVFMGSQIGKVVSVDGNIRITDPAAFFVDPAALDFNPLPGGPLDGAGVGASIGKGVTRRNPPIPEPAVEPEPMPAPEPVDDSNATTIATLRMIAASATSEADRMEGANALED